MTKTIPDNRYNALYAGFSFKKVLTAVALSLFSLSLFAQEETTTIQENQPDFYSLLIGILIFTLVLVVLVVFYLAHKVIRISSDRVYSDMPAFQREFLKERDARNAETVKAEPIKTYANVATDGGAETLDHGPVKNSESLVSVPKQERKSYSLIPGASDYSSGRNFPGGGKEIKLDRGYNLKLEGKARKSINPEFQSDTYAVKPTDFFGISPIPKMKVDIGDEVKAGDVLFFDKQRSDVMFTAPVSGEVVEIRRGAKRAITEVVILADKKNQYREFPKADPRKLTREAIVEQLLESGCWLFFVQRPFGLIADSSAVPRDIFISGFDSSPLAPDYNYLMKGQEQAFQTGIYALNKLTAGNVHLSLNTKKQTAPAFANAEGVVKHGFEGPHPAGMTGIQIHHIAPIKKGDIVWQVNPYDVAIIGKLFLEGRFNTEKLVSLNGAEVKERQYYKTYLGASVKNMLAGNLVNDHVRVISGNVYTGKKIEADGHIGYSENMVTVVEEGDKHEFLGWLIPSFPRPSISRTFPWAFMPFQRFRPTTNTHGEERAFVMTGQYELVTPMDMYPQLLLKSILYRDFDQMEGLGIYEVLEEDLALCEFVCTSKTHVQEILRDGLDYMIEQS